MSAPRVLVVCHGHPDLVPGGTEFIAHDLSRALRENGGAETMFLGCVTRLHRQPRDRGRLQAIGRSAGVASRANAAGSEHDMLLWVDGYDPFMMVQAGGEAFARAMRELLDAFAPDIVHFHHLSLIGIDALAMVRRLRPQARIVVTLHDYMTLCANDGLMVQRGSNRRCRTPSVDACHRCRPEMPQADHRLRELQVRTMFGLVDMFVAPSRFLRDRFVEWGLAPERIAMIRNGVPAVRAGARPAADDGAAALHYAFACFGNLAAHKGAVVALEAAARLKDLPVSVEVHGGMNFQPESFRDAFDTALTAAVPVASWRGPYERDELSKLMAGVGWVIVPSTWWENAPLVILEAFRRGRPVICSDIGGMAEMVKDGVNGLHFRAGDPADLARVMRRAAGDRELWQRLATHRHRVPTPQAMARAHLKLYGTLLDDTRDAA